MRSRLFRNAALALLASAAVAAHADTYTYSFSGAMADSFSFSIASMPTSSSSMASAFTIASVPIMLDGASQTDTLAFYGSAFGGGLSIVGASHTYSYEGTVLFSGSGTLPTMILAPFSLTELEPGVGPPNGDGPGMGTVTDLSAVPEPPALLLMATGVLALARRLIRRAC